MARRLRIQYPGALYHVINRGNYRRDVFETAGAARAFELAMAEACLRHRWRLHAYTIMRNHFHFALETPLPNLVRGMHWLQGAFASRFNRFRGERGHLFQGRYEALLVENTAALVRVIHYIHLNPVRAKIVPPHQCGGFRWSSLRKLRPERRPPWLFADPLLAQMGFADTTAGWTRYEEFLADLALDREGQSRLEFGRLESGWAIGTAGWRREIAREYRQLALSPGLDTIELRELEAAAWTENLHRLLAEAGKTIQDASNATPEAPWKVPLAAALREAGAPYHWIRGALNMVEPHKIRTQVFHFNERRTP